MQHRWSVKGKIESTTALKNKRSVKYKEEREKKNKPHHPSSQVKLPLRSPMRTALQANAGLLPRGRVKSFIWKPKKREQLSSELHPVQGPNMAPQSHRTKKCAKKRNYGQRKKR